MGKIGLASVSLISAIPGGVLTFLLALAVMNHLAGMPTAMKGAAIVVLLIAALMTLFPLYLLVLYRGRKVVLAKDKVSAYAPAAAAAVGGGALADEFLDDFNPSADDIIADQREEEVFGDSGQFLSSSELSMVDDYSDDQTQEFSGDLEAGLEDFGADSSASLATVEFSMEQDDELQANLSDDFLSIVDDEIAGNESHTGDDSEAELLTGGGLDDDFNFELFDEEDDKKK